MKEFKYISLRTVFLILFVTCPVIYLSARFYPALRKDTSSSSSNFGSASGNIVKLHDEQALGKVQVGAGEAELGEGSQGRKRLPKSSSCGNHKLVDNHRFDCYPEPGATQSNCQARGCCWAPSPSSSKSGKGKAGSGKAGSRNLPAKNSAEAETSAQLAAPCCYYPLDYASYKYGALKQTEFGFSADLVRTTTGYYPRDIMNLQLDAFFETDNRLRIKVYDPKNKRYEVPIPTPPFTKKATNPAYKVQLGSSGIIVTRVSTGEVVFNTTINPGFIYADQFIQISTSLSSPFIYGLGEHRASLARSTNWQSFTFWTRDQFPKLDGNLYGAHPFYVNLEANGDAHGVFLLNSNAMDVILQPTPAITYRTIGGILDFYILLGPDPIDVVRQYQEVVGFPFMPPMWSLGFHLCRWGYETAKGTKAVVDRMRKAGIPQDVQWNDIEYSQGDKDYTLNLTTFGTLPDLIADIHAKGQHYMQIVDPAIAASEPKGTYAPYDTGVTEDIFMKAEDGSILVGSVWPGDTAFPDWFHPKVASWWEALAKKFHDTVAYDGMWLDMNEPSNFVDGSTTGCSKTSPYDNPPYVPAVTGKTLWNFTTCPSAKQHIGSHYNLHNLYGMSEVNVTYGVLANIRQKRPFIISRSSFPSSGVHGGHWLGDNVSEWPEMHYSIIGILNFNMYGIPMVGADICGFRGNTTENLCTRWTQLGSFYPFSRNHNDRFNRHQDPANFSDASIASSRTSLLVRYSLLPYLYTLFHDAHAKGSMVARPLFFNFPKDPSLYTVDTLFMWGEAVLITPVLKENATKVTATFPPGVWYDYYGAPPLVFKKTTTHELDAPWAKINVHFRGGFIVPSLPPNTTTTATRQNPFTLVVALDGNQRAEGNLYWDDGDTIDTYEAGKYISLSFQAANNKVTTTVTHNAYSASSEMKFGGGTVLGVASKPQTVTVSGKSCPFTYVQGFQKLNFTCATPVPFNKPLSFTWK